MYEIIVHSLVKNLFKIILLLKSYTYYIQFNYILYKGIYIILIASYEKLNKNFIDVVLNALTSHLKFVRFASILCYEHIFNITYDF